jgi:hypothetical protein
MHDAGPPVPPDTRRPRPTEAELKNAQLYIRWSATLLIGAVLTTGLFLPWKLIPVALGAAAVVVGIISLVKMIRAGLPVVLRVATLFGIVAAFMLTAVSGVQVLTWPLTQDYEQCMSRALTEQAKEQCLADYQERLLRFSGAVQP